MSGSILKPDRPGLIGSEVGAGMRPFTVSLFTHCSRLDLSGFVSDSCENFRLGIHVLALRRSVLGKEVVSEPRPSCTRGRVRCKGESAEVPASPPKVQARVVVAGRWATHNEEPARGPSASPVPA